MNTDKPRKQKAETPSLEEIELIAVKAAEKAAQMVLQHTQPFELDEPAPVIREKLKATDPKKWERILKETGARCSRVIGCTQMFYPSAFPQLRASASY